MADISVSLTQFIDFTIKRNGLSKISHIRRIKGYEYNPATDYWKRLRDEIKRIHQNNLDLDELDSLVDKVNEKKKANYAKLIRFYKKHFRNKRIEWFDPGNSNWMFDNQLLVRSSPELGLYINGKPHIVKLYFKGEDNRIDVNNIKSTITLMNESSFNKSLPDETITSVLNIRRNKMYSDNDINENLLISLESEAQQFIYLWNNI